MKDNFYENEVDSREQYFTIFCEGQTYHTAISDVYYIVRKRNWAVYHFREKILHAAAVEDMLKEQLCRGNFVRIGPSCHVNPQWIVREEKSCVILENGEKLEAKQTLYDDF